MTEIIVHFRFGMSENDRARRDVKFHIASEIQCSGGINSRLKRDFSSSGRGAGKATVISGTASLPDTADDNTESSRDDITDSTQNVPARDDDPGEGYGNEPGNAGSVSGYRMDETKQKTPTDSVRDFLSNPVFSTSNIVVILVILLLIGIIFYGYRKKGL